VTFDLSNNKTKINICENLDWKRQFGLHLWYHHLPTDHISSALESFEKNISAGYCRKPYPPYIEDKTVSSLIKTKEFFDTCYHLIKLFCDKTHPLAEIISPQCHTSNMLDLRLTLVLFLKENSLLFLLIIL
jgi:nuclear pore complex protein Nup98-Nup96